jgi:hypothetical protein
MALFIKYTTKYYYTQSQGLIIQSDNDPGNSMLSAQLLSNNIPNKLINDINKYFTLQDGPNPNLKSIYYEASKKNYLKITNPFKTYNSGLSFTFWFKAGSNPTWARFFDFGNGAAQDNIICYINSNQIGFSVYKRSTNSINQFNVIPNVLDNKWHHIVWTLNTDKTWIIYLDNSVFKTYTDKNYPDSITRNINYIAQSNWADPNFTGNITDFRIYNSTINKNEIEQIYYEGLGQSQFNVSGSKKEFKKNDLLYSYIFTNLYDNKNNYNDCKNCSFEFDKIDMNLPIVNGPEGCKDECSNNNKCTSYSYDSNKKKCFNYLNYFPDNIYNDVKDVNSGYKLSFPYDYTQLNDNQKNNIKKIIANEFLNYKFTPNKKIDYTKCNTITENANQTTFNNEPECIFNLMRENNISNNIDFTFDYKNDPKFQNSINDNEMVNYYNKFKRNLFNVNEKTVLAPISNIGIHAPVDTESKIDPSITANEISDSIKSNTKPKDTFSNQYIENYNKNYKIIIIILLLIILGFFIYKLNN